MSKDKLIIITIIIFILALGLVNYKCTYYFIYKNRAESMVIDRMKEKYNINVDISKVKVKGYFGLYTSFDPQCNVEFIYDNKKYYAVVDTIKKDNKVYDNYQYKDITSSFMKMINDKIGYKGRDYKLYYHDELSDYYTNGLIYDYFDGNNYKDVIRNGSLSIYYDEIIDDSIIKDTFNDYSNEFRVEVYETNKSVEDMTSGISAITCVNRNIYINSDYRDNKFDKSEKYRLDFGDIKAYGSKEDLEKTSITKIEPFDLSEMKEYDENKFNRLSDYYSTTCDNCSNYVTFFVPIKHEKKEYYRQGVIEYKDDGEVKKDIGYVGAFESVDYITIAHYSSFYRMDHVILEDLDRKKNYSR